MQHAVHSHRASPKTLILLLSALFIVLFLPLKALAQINIVAAENFYGSVAKQLGGKHVTITSILNNPNEDPHTYSADPEVARKIAEANLIIYNGVGYDEWMKRLLSTKGKKNRRILVVGDLIGVSKGDNPHIWYDPNTMQTFANSLTQTLIHLDPMHESYYEMQLQQFMKQQQALINYVNYLKQQLAGTPVTATEPLFNAMATALGLKMYNIGFQMSVMNEMPPSPSEIKNMLSDLQNHRVKLLLYNEQTTDSATENIKNTAKQNNIPIVGLSETQPANMSYHEWMHSELAQIVNALQK